MIKYNVKGIIWPLGYEVKVDMNFDTLERAEKYIANKTATMLGEQWIITPYMA